MDDEAASQQLMSEARALHTKSDTGPAIPLSFDGASECNTGAKTPGSSAKKARKSKRKQPAAPRPDPRDTNPASAKSTFSLKGMEAFVGPSPSKSQAMSSTIPDTQVEVPDTQTKSRTSHAPSSTPLKSSQAVATGSSSKKKTKKNKQSARAEMDLDSSLQEGTGAIASTSSSLPKAQKLRKKTQPSSSQTEQAAMAVEQGTVPATQYEDAIHEPVTASSRTTPVGRKQRNKAKSRNMVNGAAPNQEAVIETPTATQDATPDVPSGGVQEHADLVEEGEPPLIPRTLLSNLKAERAQSSPTASKLKKPRKRRDPPTEIVDQHTQESLPEVTTTPSPDVHEQTSLAQDDANESVKLSDAEHTITPAQTPGTSHSAKKRRRGKKDKQDAQTPLQAYDWEAPVRNLDETPTQPFRYEDSDEAEPPVEDDEDGVTEKKSSGPSRRKRSTSGRSTPRVSVGGLPRTPSRRYRSRADPNRNYQRDRDDEDERTAAEMALENSHELGQPPDKRTGGDYTADEKELLRRAIRDYQERNHLEVADLVEIIQWNNARRKEMGNNTTDQTEATYKEESTAFWDDIKSAGLLRPLFNIQRHVRARYHLYQRGHWSQDEDDNLRELTNLHPGEWKLIATSLNRLEIDVYNRWKDYVRHGENRITKRWSPEEEENFVKILSTVCQRIEDHLAEIGKPPLNDYTSFINWHEVCREMGDTRSRLQCQSKWKLMRAREPPAVVDVEIKLRKTPEPGQNEQPAKKRRKSTKGRKSTGPVTQARAPGPEDMLWGDKFDLTGHLAEQAVENDWTSDDQIAWQDIAEKMDLKWSVPTLQTAYKQLLGLVEEEEEEFLPALTSIYAYIVENHKLETEDHYTPAHELDGDAEDEVLPNSSKKRKRQSGVGASTKRTKATSSTSKAFKSKELITDSDNADSEPEQ
ncbi:RNA polymerase I enhancer binding protein [Neodidymelliopsis sp. IMI 364377]|nr:RNA polymerase I enhancer binding protein [Neodidymelliopsis sp. IMI 364377]